MKMLDTDNLFITALAVVIITISGCFTYVNITNSNNSKEIVTRAIERGLDPVLASCATKIDSDSFTRGTCEKYFISKGSK